MVVIVMMITINKIVKTEIKGTEVINKNELVRKGVNNIINNR
jgi:hypothetical protein